MDKKKSKKNPYVVQNAIIQNIVYNTIFRREGVDGIEFVTNTSSSCVKKKTKKNPTMLNMYWKKFNTAEQIWSLINIINYGKLWNCDRKLPVYVFTILRVSVTRYMYIACSNWINIYSMHIQFLLYLFFIYSQTVKTEHKNNEKVPFLLEKVPWQETKNLPENILLPSRWVWNSLARISINFVITQLNNKTM